MSAPEAPVPTPGAGPVEGVVVLRPRQRAALRQHPRVTDPVGLVLVAHGTACLAGEDEATALADRVAADRPGTAVALGFLSQSRPSGAEAVDAVVAAGCTEVVVVPLLLFAAGHAREDVPAIAADAARRHPGLRVGVAEPLGVVPELVDLAVSHVRGAPAGADGVAGFDALVLVAAGSSDAGANAEAYRAARLVAEAVGAPALQVAFTGVTWPRVPEALAAARACGHRRLVVLSWMLFPGVLWERARAAVDAERAGGAEIIEVAGFGPHPVVARLLGERFDAARRTRA